MGEDLLSGYAISFREDTSPIVFVLAQNFKTIYSFEEIIFKHQIMHYIFVESLFSLHILNPLFLRKSMFANLCLAQNSDTFCNKGFSYVVAIIKIY